MHEKILVTGPFGQIGSELVPKLQERYGKENVVALGHRHIPDDFQGSLETGDVRDMDEMKKLFDKYGFTQVYHLASLLSAVGEKKPELAWDVNVNGLKIFLDICSERNIKLFWASSIAVFGPTSPMENTPQHTILEPTSIYGITKVTGELLCKYYHERYGLDVRSLRYPGLISWKEEPGGGTTDYAVEIFYEAIEEGKYTCFVSQETKLPMMYMDDAVRGTLMLMEAEPDDITIRMSYNHAALSFTAKELEEEIRKHIPELRVDYVPDERQNIADTWPDTIDDSTARKDWGWDHEFDLPNMTKEMIANLKRKMAK